MIENDPDRAPLVVGFRQTENARTILSGARQPGRPPANLHNPAYLAENPPPERVVGGNGAACMTRI